MIAQRRLAGVNEQAARIQGTGAAKQGMCRVVSRGKMARAMVRWVSGGMVSGGMVSGEMVSIATASESWSISGHLGRKGRGCDQAMGSAPNSPLAISPLAISPYRTSIFVSPHCLRTKGALVG
jgi:hypothetical protein